MSSSLAGRFTCLLVQLPAWMLMFLCPVTNYELINFIYMCQGLDGVVGKNM
jgi:hypothetical protein